MPRATVTQRLRSRLKSLLKHGDQTAIERWSRERPGGNHISQQELSYFLRETAGRRGLVLDDLDDLAAFFRISIGELLGDTKTSELSGDEQRLVYAFRALPGPTQAHFLALVEAASLVPQKALRHETQARIKETQPHGVAYGPVGVSAADPASEPGEDPAAELGALRRYLSTIAAQIAAAATGAAPDRSLSGVSAPETHRRGLAD